jgi:transposase-like protein
LAEELLCFALVDHGESKSTDKQFLCPHGGRRIRFGGYFRKSDRKFVRRYRCLSCKRTYSNATFKIEKYQKKRQLNEQIFLLLCSGLSQRRLSLLLNIHRVTVARKLKFLSLQAGMRQTEFLKKFETSPILDAQFDEMETHLHTKLKPLSLALAVCKNTRTILGFKVSSMPAKGHLAEKSRKKYGPRPDERGKAMRELFSEIAPRLSKSAVLMSDENPKYPNWIKPYPWRHKTVRGRRGCIVGQGELKKVGFDPLFSLNHTCAMIRANVNRLFRRTWCTTKCQNALIDHLTIYMDFHNRILI